MKHPRAVELKGQRFGRLYVIGLHYTDKKNGRVWLCMCRCGELCLKTSGRLRDKHVKEVSCGCARKDSIRKAAEAGWKVTTKFSHPLKLKLKWLYRNMIKRCHDPRDKRYSDYGGRGITVCEEWRQDRYTFYKWCIENGVKEELQIDRKNNDGPYSPENCKWSTRYEQANNTRTNKFYTWNGETKTIAQWARLSAHPKAFLARANKHWPVEKIFTQPYRKCIH